MQTCVICGQERYSLSTICDPCLHRMDVLEIAFLELRKAWFDAHLESKPHEREWEDEERHQERERRNSWLRDKYDQQTQEIIDGFDRKIAPTCAADLG